MFMLKVQHNDSIAAAMDSLFGAWTDHRWESGNPVKKVEKSSSSQASSSSNTKPTPSTSSTTGTHPPRRNGQHSNKLENKRGGSDKDNGDHQRSRDSREAGRQYKESNHRNSSKDGRSLHLSSQDHRHKSRVSSSHSQSSQGSNSSYHNSSPRPKSQTTDKRTISPGPDGEGGDSKRSHQFDGGGRPKGPHTPPFSPPSSNSNTPYRTPPPHRTPPSGVESKVLGLKIDIKVNILDFN